MARHIVAVTDASFDNEVLHSETPVLVDFWATWCGPCRMFGPILEEVSGIYNGKMKFVKADVDQNPNVARKYSIRGVPTIILFKNGEILATQVGALTKAQLTEFLNSHI